MDESQAVVTAEYRELDVVRGGSGASSVPFLPFDYWRPVPIPEEWVRTNDKGEEVQYFVNRKALSKPTPESQRKIHFKNYRYVEIDYVKRRLNEYADNGRWTFLITKREFGRTYTAKTAKGVEKTYIETMVGGWLLAPGILPTYGEGSAPWAQDDQGDPRFSQSTAYNSAESMAIKSAAKKLGIGADIREDEAGDPVLAGQRATCVSMFNKLAEKGKDKALAIVKKRAPNALSGDTLIAEAISEDDIDDLLKALTDGFMAKAPAAETTA